MRILAIVTIILFIHFSVHAQKQDNVWCMGFNGGIDFNTSPPTKLRSSMYSIETTASISDRHTGALLFYTDGSRIWDASHSVMRNATGLGLDEKRQSSVQGAVIVPFIDDETKYYLFTLPAITPNAGKLAYSVVDMTLNNGLGAVMQGMKMLSFGSDFTEGMIAMQGCEMIWIITQSRTTGDFCAFKISSAGVDTTPVISPLNYSQRPSSQAGLRASPDYTRIASVGNFLNDDFGDHYLALHDFDPVTGKVTNGLIADTGAQITSYGCEFSPNGQLLYIASEGKVYQYNLSSPADAIAASKKMVSASSTNFLHNLQLRDDGNIYIVRYESQYLDMISNCDAPAPACVFTEKAVEIGGNATYNLPAKIVLPKTAVAGNNTKKDVTTCSGLPVTLRAIQNNATWQDGSKDNIYTADKAGTYWVRGYSADCMLATDTFVVRDCHLFFPSAFSPNGDGKNDIARMAGDVGSLTDFALNIYNRWGQLVFTGTNPHEGWNGMHGASLADLGVYFYYIQYRYQGKYELMKGDITLVR